MLTFRSNLFVKKLICKHNLGQKVHRKAIKGGTVWSGMVFLKALSFEKTVAKGDVLDRLKEAKVIYGGSKTRFPQFEKK